MSEYTPTLKNVQGLSIPHIETNPKILFNIKRINEPWKTLLYVTAWKMIPPLYYYGLSKTNNRQIIAMYAREFKSLAYCASITVGRGARLAHVLTYLQRSDESAIPGRNKAREFIAKYLNLQIGEE